MGSDFQGCKFNSDTQAYAVQSDNNKPADGQSVTDVKGWQQNLSGKE